MDSVVTSSINAAVSQAHETYRYSLRSGISDALHEEIRTGFLEMMQLINEVIKPTEHSAELERVMATPPELVVLSQESEEQNHPDADFLSSRRRLVTDPPAKHLVGTRDLHLQERRELAVWKRQPDEWFTGVRDQTFCWDPG
ncbi:hypothetical protein ACLKA7_012202 [Drosophila subpalustris]